MSASFDFDAPDHFTAGTVGAPGQRTFYVQGRESGIVVTLKLEKEQVGALAEYLSGLLAKLGATAEQAPTDLALLEPVEPAWVIGSIGVGYEEADDRIVVVATELTEDEGEEGEETMTAAEAETAVEPPPPEAMPSEPDQRPSAPETASARFRLTRAQAAGFVERARALVSAGRPICPMCAGPKDPGGHICPRSNGHVRSAV